MYRFLLRPRWLLGHVLAVALVVFLASLGLWQLRRLDERRDYNALVARRSETVVPLPAEGWNGPSDPARLAFRRVRVQGTYLPAKEVLVRFRSNQGLPGYHVLTPMTTARGTIIVNRGWVPLAMGNRWPDAGARPPEGERAIEGLLRRSQPGSRFLPSTPTSDAPMSVGSVYVAGLERRLGTPLYPLYLQLDGPKPKPTPTSVAATTASYPASLPAPELDEGPHLAYAAQWFIFAAGAAVGWVMLVRISTRKRHLTNAQGQPEAAGPPQGR